MWEEVQKAIAEVFVMKEKHIVEAVSNFDLTVITFKSVEEMRFFHSFISPLYSH